MKSEYRMDVVVNVTGRSVTVREIHKTDAEDVHHCLTVETYGKSKYRVSSCDWRDGKRSIVDAEGLMEWMVWARIGKARRVSIMTLLKDGTAADSQLTATGRVRKNRRIMNGLRKGRTFRSMMDEFGVSQAAIKDQVSLMSAEDVVEYLDSVTASRYAVRSKEELAFLDQCIEDMA